MKHPDAWVPVVLEGWRRGQQLSAVGPGEVDAHLDHARAVERRLPPKVRRCLDLGAGAGIPGLALAGLRPETRWVLLDAARRRTRLLEEIVAELGWGDRVTVIHGRAEELGRAPDHRGQYDLVTARLFGPPSVTAECAAPLLRDGGHLVVAEPPTEEPDRWPATHLPRLSLHLAERFADPALQILRRSGSIDDRYPRRPGVPQKHPLW